ncbi:hypothetical protein GCM10017557_31690 [Streptomyces aurantiacus]|uniref:Uncharacterized protein n=1 Tax=Streptomyces aurantiacus TaxID=47760 RepID=A0A7G1P323_9ACTN|nr:hypothetical protein GCM10017557_31690 [Streptomyces aurantiacus]
MRTALGGLAWALRLPPLPIVSPSPRLVGYVMFVNLRRPGHANQRFPRVPGPGSKMCPGCDERAEPLVIMRARQEWPDTADTLGV